MENIVIEPFDTSNTAQNPIITNEFISSISKPDIDNVCYQNHLHDQRCNPGKMNYPDILKWGKTDLEIHMLQYPQQMSYQDYVNWIWAFINNNMKLKLPYKDLSNLDIMLNGGNLKSENFSHIYKANINNRSFTSAPFHILLNLPEKLPSAMDHAFNNSETL